MRTIIHSHYLPGLLNFSHQAALMKFFFLYVFLLFSLITSAQKKPLDHSVYDAWQSIGERIISNDGKWIVYTVTPQEGDAELFIRSTADTSYKKQVPRGYSAVITEDSRFLVFKIRPYFSDTREAKIKKKKPEDYPKDSIGIIELGKDPVWKAAKVKSFKTPEKGKGWMAYHKEKDPVAARTGSVTQKTVDSLKRTVDSLTLLVMQMKATKGQVDNGDADEEGSSPVSSTEGSDLVVKKLSGGKERVFPNVVDYYFNKYGQKLAMRVSKSPRDNNSANAVLLMDLVKETVDTILKGGNDFRQFSLSEDGRQLAFLAERDTGKLLQRFYGLYLYRDGDDSAALLVDKKSPGMQLGMTVSEHGLVNFSRSGKRVFFGTSPIQAVRDTSLVDVDLVKLDIWHYKDDYLQTRQLSLLGNETKRSFLAVYDFTTNKIEQLGAKALPSLVPTNEGDGKIFIALSDTGRRLESQWMGRTKTDVYALNTITGNATLVKKNHEGLVSASPSGKYILLYDLNARNYFSWDGNQLRNISSRIKSPLFNVENDIPDHPAPYGIMGWHEGDSAVYVYDRYDVWKLDPENRISPMQVTAGAQQKISYRYLKLDPDERFISWNNPLYFRSFSQANKYGSIVAFDRPLKPRPVTEHAGFAYMNFVKARNADMFLFSKENFSMPPDLYYIPGNDKTFQGTGANGNNAVKISSLNPQQSLYNWGSADLYNWKTFDGKQASGILYKPADFDSLRKYPVLIYFYERMSDNLYRYYSPAPSASTINIPFFVSRGYLVFVPDVFYTQGHPGKGAYNYIVSGAQSLAGKKWVDAKNMGIQGQSWGGYQVAYLVTATNMFKAAWAGAPVVNMFSAYGGIRWGSGLNRQFQYERTQSRIGATPWERPDLYIENSPFFHLKKVNTPLVIMANDADDAVPWYQGIEFFTAMRRLGKKVWLLNYNTEVHNLMERKNRKDISIRLQQYFDWLLKGEKPALWITEGLPAIKKGKTWGLEIVD